MGGRGSGGSHNAGGKLSKNIGAGITDRNELVNLYNSISGNPSYTAEERVRAMSSIKERIDKLDAKKAEDLKQKRLEALAKARAKRAENIKNGIPLSQEIPIPINSLKKINQPLYSISPAINAC
mgnify:CR=1 FL=1